MDNRDFLEQTKEFLDSIENDDRQEQALDNVPKYSNKRGVRISPVQKFILSIMVFVFILIAGLFILLIQGKITL